MGWDEVHTKETAEQALAYLLQLSKIEVRWPALVLGHVKHVSKRDTHALSD